MPIEKQENGKTVKYKMRFIDSVRFMASSFLTLTDNLAERLHKGKCKDLSQTLNTLQPKMVYSHSNVWSATKHTRKSLMKIYPRDLEAHISSVMETIIKFVSCCREMFILLSTWMAGNDSMKLHYPPHCRNLTVEGKHHRR